jgi:hypothetical protein
MLVSNLNDFIPQFKLDDLLVTYCIPVAPGKSRLVAQFPRNFAKILHYLTPRWFSHLKVRNQIIDGDMILLLLFL